MGVLGEAEVRGGSRGGAGGRGSGGEGERAVCEVTLSVREGVRRRRDAESVPGAAAGAGRPPSRHLHAHLCSSSPEHLAPPRRPQAMFLARLTSQLLRVVPRAGMRPRGAGHLGGIHTWAGDVGLSSPGAPSAVPHQLEAGARHTSSPVNVQLSQTGDLGLRTCAVNVLCPSPGRPCSRAQVWGGPRAVTAVLFPVGCSRLGPVSEVLGSHACRPCCSTQPTGPSGVASLPGRGIQLELEQMLVPRKMSISPLESWLTARYLLPRLDAGASAQLYKCPPSQVGEGAEQGGEGVWDASWMQCKNILKIRRRKMNHHKYRKLVKRTRFLRRKVREGRLKRKQVNTGAWGGARWLRDTAVPQAGGPSFCLYR